MLTFAKGLIFPGVVLGSFAAFDALLKAGVEPGVALFAATVGNLIVVALHHYIR